MEAPLHAAPPDQTDQHPGSCTAPVSLDWAFEQSPDCIKLIAPDGNLLAMNRNGQSALEIDDVGQFYGTSWANLWPEAARPTVLAAIAGALTGRVERFDALCPTARGTLRWWDVVLTPMLAADGTVERLLAVSRDMSALREAIDHDLETAARLQFTLAATRLGEWEIDLVTGAWLHNERFDACFGHPPGAPSWNLAALLARIHPDDRARVASVFDFALANCATLHFDSRICWHDGSVHWITMQGSCYRSALRPDSHPRLLGIVDDISERMALTETLRDAAHKKDEFLAMLAHELRNPLAPISAAAQLLALGGANERMTQRAGAVIDRQARHMNRLLDDLLDTARVTQGLVSLDMQRIELKHIIVDAVEQARPMIEQHRHHLNLQIAPGPVCVEGDDKRLVQVLVNLLNNAAKYTQDGGTINLRLECADCRACISVSDNGIGMDASTLANAFTLFSQADRSSDRTAGGLGLGLALVKTLVERHDGQVRARSAGKGMGSEFVVSLPLSSGECAIADRGEPPAPASIAPAPLRLLIVDDNRDAAEMMGMLLAEAGHQVALAFNGVDALCHAGRSWPDVFLLDIGLPDLSGYELARAVRAMPGGVDATIIAVTGYGSPADRAISRQAGIDHHLTKPVDIDQLAQLLAQVVPRR
ncbi:hybrid sensor histidine kinase/response regulator [Massilia sp. DWR3-1-1]|uniref:PAS domain-containing hybrid sensor histidine kinase/response regulator n=1 Tax=Massilia sp. DWR3-1-1 TaxID=2804559 RepID=UPI003CF28697